MISPTRFGLKTMSENQDRVCVIHSGLDNGADVTLQRVSAPARDCSGRAADAVRNRTLSPSPAADHTLAWSLSPPPSRSRLTPARWQSKIMAGQSRGLSGAGNAVASATSPQPICNRHPIEIAGYSRRLQRLRAQASRVTCACVCVQTRAYTRGLNPATLQPSEYLYVDHKVSGCREVAQRLQLQPSMPRSRSIGANARFRDILAAIYRRAQGAALLPNVLAALSTVLQGRVGESFGVFGLGRRGLVDRDRADLLEVDQAVRNGGFLRFSRPASARVGRPMLDGSAQGVEIACFSDAARKPLRLGAGRPGGLDRAGHPPMPPFATTSLPSMLARYRGRIWIGLRPAQSRNECEPGGPAQNLRLWNGSGCGRRGLTRHPATGRGGKNGGLAGKLRRICDASGRRDRVN